MKKSILSPACFAWVLIFTLTSVCFSRSLAQDVFVSENLIVGSATEIFLPAQVVNNGFIQNNGTMSIMGDWNNSKIYQGKGTLKFVGSSIQKISNNNLAVANILIDGAGVVVSHNLIIDETLSLNNGNVLVKSGDSLIIDSEAAILGGSFQSFIDGPVTIHGVGYKNIPLGINGTFTPLELHDVKGIEPNFQFHVSANESVQPEGELLSRSPYSWHRTDISGAFLGSGVTLSLEGITDLENLVIAGNGDEDDETVIIRDVTVQSGENKIISSGEIYSKNIYVGNAKPESPDASYMSTTLSPNASRAENRYVKIFGSKFVDDDFFFAVFDRWGKEVFRSNSLEKMITVGWDGTSRDNNILANGVYPYALNARDTSGRTFSIKGVITIVH